MTVTRKHKRVFTVEFTTFVVYADSKQEAWDIIRKYITKQSADLDNFFSQRAKITEKEIFASLKENKS